MQDNRSFNFKSPGVLSWIWKLLFVKLLYTIHHEGLLPVKWVHWFVIKCSLKNPINRLPEYSWTDLLPWQVVNMVDWCVKIRFWSGEKIPPLFDMVAVWKGKAGAHAHNTIHWPADRGRHRLPFFVRLSCKGSKKTRKILFKTRKSFTHNNSLTGW